MNPLGRAFSKLFLLAARALPRRVASHCMHLLRHSPGLTDAWGYHVRPIHYYEPVPDFRTLTRERLARRRTPPGIAIDIPAQARRLESLASRFGAEIRALDHDGSGGFDFRNDYFAGLDAAVYYALIRETRPARIVEIGAGYSTRIAGRALAANAAQGAHGSITVVEPHPQPRLLDAGLEMTLIERPLEEVDPAVFAQLAAGDILFVDSSHALRCGGDVFVVFLEILPRLAPGVRVHIHDIFLPFDYPEDWVLGQRLAFNEQYLLEAFLAFNGSFSIEIANRWLALEAPGAAGALWPGGLDAGASSFWISRNDGAARAREAR